MNKFGTNKIRGSVTISSGRKRARHGPFVDVFTTTWRSRHTQRHVDATILGRGAWQRVALRQIRGLWPDVHFRWLLSLSFSRCLLNPTHMLTYAWNYLVCRAVAARKHTHAWYVSFYPSCWMLAIRSDVDRKEN